MPRKSKRQPKLGAQPAKFGIQHFFARVSSLTAEKRQQQQVSEHPIKGQQQDQGEQQQISVKQQQQDHDVQQHFCVSEQPPIKQQQEAGQVEEQQQQQQSAQQISRKQQFDQQQEQQNSFASQQLLHEDQQEHQQEQEQQQQQQHEQRQNLERNIRKRIKLLTSELSPQSLDDGDDEIVWKASPLVERWQGLTPAEFSMRPCDSRKPTNVSTPKAIDSSNKENIPTSQLLCTPKLLQQNRPSPAPQCKTFSFTKQGSRRKGKRKVLLDLLDQVKFVISDDQVGSGESPGIVQVPPNVSDDIERRTENCKITAGGEPNIYYLVLEVSETESRREHGHCCPQKVLRVLDEKNAIEKLVYLRDEWNFTEIRPGDTANIIGDFDADGKCVIDHDKNILILHPDVLVSGSRVGSSSTCPRRAVLDERVKSSETSLSALLGTMLHRLFQIALTAQKPSNESLRVEAEKIILDHIEGLYAMEGDDKVALNKLVDAIPILLDWVDKHKHVRGSSEPNLDFGIATGMRHISISEVTDIEEMIFSPKYGLKGMIDASLKIDDKHMPLEFKTGKATTGQAGVEHRAQVILYTLLMSDRYSEDVNEGMLYYLHTKQTLGIHAQRADLTGLLMRRNAHAANLLRALSTQTLPPRLQSSHICRGCPMVEICSVYHKLQDGGTAGTSCLGETFDALTGHLKRKHGEFLQQWEHLIDLEAQVHYSGQSELWRACSGQREERGRCLSSMAIRSFSDDRERSGNFVYCFERLASSSDKPKSHRSTFDQTFTLGDYVLLSTESGHFAIAAGIVKSLSSDSIQVSVSHSLKLPGQSKDVKQIFREAWRLHKDDSSACFAIMRYNLLQLFIRDGARRSRELIVDLEVPRFDGFATASQVPASSFSGSQMGLNDDQCSAVGKILSARDYALILGMPGTGKTTAIVYAVKALLARGSSVLLASYTNSAVDNILLKLKLQEIDFIRVGRSEAIHAELAQHAIRTNVTSVDEMRLKIDQARVVGVTCLGIAHALFTRKKFDVCIIDEAGQITLPVCIGPLRYAHTFILVGDHYQLPPLVQSAEAREKGMAISLFQKLSEAHPQAVTALECQYRMCSSIMNLSNFLIYGSRLRCGSAEVANARLYVNTPKGLPAWTQEVLDSARNVLFLDTDGLILREQHRVFSKHNNIEASVLINVVHGLTQGGVGPASIGVISPYKAQVVHIAQRLGAGVEVQTIDKYQGRDKDCILVSFVQSQNQRPRETLLTDWHRINVAITRAKKKLIMIGSVAGLSSIPLLKLLIEQVQHQGGLLKLPEDALAAQ